MATQKIQFYRPENKWVNGVKLTCGVAFMLSLSSVSALEAGKEPPLPAVDSQVAGYFPTIAEDTLLRGPQDSRSGGTGPTVEGPDTRGLIATDLFRYYDNDPDFYQRNQNFFRPINKGLGFLTPHDVATVESARLQQANLTADADFNILTREFEPELAHIKAGPLYFDILWAGAGLIYSDFNGVHTQSRSDNNGDGLTGFVEVGVRGLLRITDSIYISAVANLIYLPWENELGLQFGNGSSAGLVLRLNVNEQVGDWDLNFFDEFLGTPGINFIVGADASAFDQSGRYTVGFLSERPNNLYDRDGAFFVNTVGFHATHPVFDNQWRFGVGLEHSDFWRTFSFEDHGKRDWLGLWMQYEGSVMPFAPRFDYQFFSTDGYRSMFHLLQLQLTGRLTENISWYGKGGFVFTTGDTTESDSFIWEVALDHTITRSTHHWIVAGENFIDNEFLPETLRSTFIRYAIDQRITSRFHANIYAQYAENETSSTARFPVRDRFGVGLSLIYRPLDFTTIQGTAYYEQVDQSVTSEDAYRWLYRIEATQQLSSRLTGNIFYQYEEADNETVPFTEHFMGVSLRRYF